MSPHSVRLVKHYCTRRPLLNRLRVFQPCLSTVAYWYEHPIADNLNPSYQVDIGQHLYAPLRLNSNDIVMMIIAITIITSDILIFIIINVMVMLIQHGV